MFAKQLVVASIIGLGALAAAPAQAIVFNLTEFTGGDAAMKVTVTDGTGGNSDKLRFQVEFVPTTNTIGDLRGIFFHIANEALIPGFSMIGITAGLPNNTVCQAADAVSSCGGGNNINGSGPEDYDIGIEIGTDGAGSDDFQNVEFFLDHSSADLDVATFFDLSAGNQSMAGRITSLGLIGGDRGNSSKLLGGPSTEPPTSVDEPLTLGLFGAGLLGLSLLRRRRKAA